MLVVRLCDFFSCWTALIVTRERGLWKSLKFEDVCYKMIQNAQRRCPFTTGFMASILFRYARLDKVARYAVDSWWSTLSPTGRNLVWCCTNESSLLSVWYNYIDIIMYLWLLDINHMYIEIIYTSNEFVSLRLYAPFLTFNWFVVPIFSVYLIEMETSQGLLFNICLTQSHSLESMYRCNNVTFSPPAGSCWWSPLLVI